MKKMQESGGQNKTPDVKGHEELFILSHVRS